MPKHKGENYKISAVEYYLENDTTYTETCNIYKCSERSLKRWIEKYNNNNGKIRRNNRNAVSYKIEQKHVRYAVKLLKKNEQITLSELAKLIKKKYKDWEEIIPKLEPAIEAQKKWRLKVPSGEFVPNWKHFKTWINSRSWEECPDQKLEYN